MFVNVNLPDGGASTISVPERRQCSEGRQTFCFRLGKARRVHAAGEVAIGSEEAYRVLILNGLRAGQQVVTDGCVLLQELME